MEKKSNKSTCLICRKEFTGVGMGKHLSTCLAARGMKEDQKTRPCLHLKVVPDFTNDYWLHLLVDAESTLKTLDKFLRDIWLECCGHMSMFTIAGGEELSNSIKIGNLMMPGMKLDYEYDMGSTTALIISVVAVHQAVLPKKKKVELLARNAPLDILCGRCKQTPAKLICAYCLGKEDGWLCKTCAADHDCDDEYFLPVVNSPRTGVCGYTG